MSAFLLKRRRQLVLSHTELPDDFRAPIRIVTNLALTGRRVLFASLDSPADGRGSALVNHPGFSGGCEKGADQAPSERCLLWG